MKKTFLSLILAIALLASCGNQPSEAEVAAKNFQDAENLTIKVNSEVSGTFFDETVSVDCLHFLKSPIDLRLSKTAMDASIQMIAGSTYKLSDLLKSLNCTVAQLKAIAPELKVDESKDTATIERPMFPENHSLAGYSEKDQQWIGYSQSETSVHARYVLNRELETLFPKEDIFAAVVDTLTKGKFDEEMKGYYFAFGEDYRPTFAAYTGALVTVSNGYPVSLEAFADIEKMNASGSAFLLGCPIESATSLYEFSKYNETTITLPNATPDVCETHNPITRYEASEETHATYCEDCHKYLSVEKHHDDNEYGVCTVCGHHDAKLAYQKVLVYDEANKPVYVFSYLETPNGKKLNPTFASDENGNRLLQCTTFSIDPEDVENLTECEYFADADALYVIEPTSSLKVVEEGHCLKAMDLSVKVYTDVILTEGEMGVAGPNGESVKDYVATLTPKFSESFVQIGFEHDEVSEQKSGEGCEVIETTSCSTCGDVISVDRWEEHDYSFTKMSLTEFKSALQEAGCTLPEVEDLEATEGYIYGKLSCSKLDSTVYVIVDEEDLASRTNLEDEVPAICLSQTDGEWRVGDGYYAFPDIPLTSSSEE